MVLVTHSMDELLTAASQKFNFNAKRLFTRQGGELDDLKLIRQVLLLLLLNYLKLNDVIQSYGCMNCFCGVSHDDI